MMPADLTDQELDGMIDKLEDRIETTQTLLSENDDTTTVSVLNQTLAKYTSQYKQCLAERDNRKQRGNLNSSDDTASSELLVKYRSMTKNLYDGMSRDKQKEWVIDFVIDSFNQLVNYCSVNSLSQQDAPELFKKRERLEIIKLTLISNSGDLNALRYAIECNTSIIEEVIDLIFNHGMDADERKIQLEGVLPNYLFIEFELTQRLNYWLQY